MNGSDDFRPASRQPLPRALLVALVDTLEEGVIVLDREARVVYWNAWMSRMARVALDDAQGRALVEVFPDLAGTRVPGAIQWALQRRLPSFLSPSLNKSPFPLGDDLDIVEQAIRISFLHGDDDVPYALVHISDVSAIVEKERTLRLRAKQLRDLTLLDPLTGVANRRRFHEYLDTELRRHRRSGSAPLSLIELDIDFFKGYNDTYGHPMGDNCLLELSAVAGSCLNRAGDLLARLGGEEFGILLPETDHEGACRLAEHVRSAVEHAGILHEASGVARVVTVSLGVATTLDAQNTQPRDLISAADAALYDAKSAGRNTWRGLVIGTP